MMDDTIVWHVDDPEMQPEKAHPTDAGYDLISPVTMDIVRGIPAVIDTGVQVAIPVGYVGLIFPRSGAGSRGLVLQNGTGVIDSGYRGTITLVAALQEGTCRYRIYRGDRIAQMVIVPIFAGKEEFSAEPLDTGTDRGTNGYGSTGI